MVREDSITHWSFCSKGMPKMKFLEIILYSYIIRISIGAGKTNMFRRNYFCFYIFLIIENCQQRIYIAYFPKVIVTNSLQVFEKFVVFDFVLFKI